MSNLLEAVERFANETYQKCFSSKTSLAVADVLSDVIMKQGLEIIYLSIPKQGNEDRMLYGMFFNTDQSLQPQIIINQLDSLRTQNFTLAHGWFHAILESKDLKKYPIQIQSKEEMKCAGDYFAAAVLMNKEVFISYFEIIKELPIEKIVFKLADIFKVPYVTVVRQLHEHNLIDVSALDSLTEKEWIEIRNNSVGKSILDARLKSRQFFKYKKTVEKQEGKGKLSNLGAGKKLFGLNSGFAEK